MNVGVCRIYSDLHKVYVHLHIIGIGKVAEALKDFISICLHVSCFSGFSSKMLPQRGPGTQWVWAPGPNLCMEAFYC